MIYIKSLNKLIYIQGYDNDNIYYIDINKKYDNMKEDKLFSNHEWKSFHGLKKPTKGGKARCIIAFDAIVLLYNKGKLWCCDIGNKYVTKFEWIKCEITVQEHLSLRMAITSTNYIHFINFHVKPTTHCKMGSCQKR